MVLPLNLYSMRLLLPENARLWSTTIVFTMEIDYFCGFICK